jgi:hypothetical protein
MLITQCGGQAKFKMACIEEVLLKSMDLVMSQVKDPIVPNSERVGAAPPVAACACAYQQRVHE